MVLAATVAKAQILAPMGHGLPAAPQKIASYQQGLVVAYENQASEVELQVWNGDFWYTITKPSLPKLGNNGLGTYAIIDLITYNNEIYLATAYTERSSSQAVNSILRWDGSSWQNMTSTTVATSTSLESMVIQNATLTCVGKFTSAGEDYNVVTLDQGQFTPSGNLITLDVQGDKFRSISTANGKLYATGNFTHPTQGSNSTLVVWDGEQWEFAQYPPFLGENITLGTYQGQAVVYGKNTFSSESVKISSGSLWSNMSAGLDDFTVDYIERFAELNGALYAVGDFTENQTNTSYNLLKYDGTEWNKTNLYLSDIEQLFSTDESVIVSGDFSDNARINYIGQIFDDMSQIAIRVYHDKNGNCMKDANESWFGNYPVTLNESIELLNTDDYGQLYLPVNKAEHTINVAEIDHWQATCPDVVVDVDEFKTYYGTFIGVNQKVGIRDAVVEFSDVRSYQTQESERRSALVCHSNIGGQPINNATLVLKHQSGIANFTSQRAYDSYLNQEATWTINMNGNDKQCFLVSYDVTDIDNALLETYIELEDGTTDANDANNHDAWSYEEGESLVNEKYSGNDPKINKSTEQLEYKIGFKNQHTLTALDLKVVDELDTDIVISKYGIYSNTSHNCELLSEYRLLPDGTYQKKLVWSFSDINLPSKDKNDALSEGFIDLTLHIAPQFLNKGDEICNNAKIYFSYKEGSFDEPILTQTVCSEVVETGSTAGDVVSAIHDLEIGPNPVNDHLFFKNGSSNDYHISLTNTLGQEFINADIDAYSEQRIQVGDLKPGIYFLFADGVFVSKFMIN